MATIKVKINGEWQQLPVYGFVPIEDAPKDGKQYARQDGTWSEISSGVQYLDLSMFTGDTGTLSEEDYQKVVNAYENKISICIGENSTYSMNISEKENQYFISIQASSGVLSGFAIGFLNYAVNKDKSYITTYGNIDIDKSGNGTKALTDNGNYLSFVEPVSDEMDTSATSENITFIGYLRREFGWRSLNFNDFILDLTYLFQEDGTPVDSLGNFAEESNPLSNQLYVLGNILSDNTAYPYIGYVKINNYPRLVPIEVICVDSKQEKYIINIVFSSTDESLNCTTKVWKFIIIGSFVEAEETNLGSIKKVIDTSTTTITKELQPNTYYEFGECTSLTLTLATEIPNIYNEYMFEFTSGTNPTQLSLPEGIKWVKPDGGEAEPPVIKVNTTYECSIVNNKAVMKGW